MSNISIFPISAFSDNYIWCIHNQRKAIVVDPGDAKPVESYLAQHGLTLEAILVTHHHPDHVGGIKSLKQAFPFVEVLGYSDAKYSGIETAFEDAQSFNRLGIEFTLVAVPGHTLDHVAYYCVVDGTTRLFCGDTLFSGGCGRLFEGTAKQMHHSLSKFKALPNDTLVYCAHEYTLSNLSFAKTLMPNNADLERYIETCNEKRDASSPTLPSNLETELKVNPFLRETDPEIIDNLRSLDYKELNTPVDIFAAIRHAKDHA